MKNYFVYAITCIVLCAFFSCKSSKVITKVEGGTELSIPLSGKDYQTDENFFRAKQSGESPNLSMAKKIGLLNAKAELAGNIHSTVESFFKQYNNQVGINNKIEYDEKITGEIKEFVNQELVDVQIIGEKVIKQENGNYQYWIAIQANRETIHNGVKNLISKDEKLQQAFEIHQFDKIYEKERERFMKEREGK